MRLRRDGPIGIARWPVWSLPRSVLCIIVAGRAAGGGHAGHRLRRRHRAARPGRGRSPWPCWPSAGIISTEASLGRGAGPPPVRRDPAHRPELGVGVRRGRAAARGRWPASSSLVIYGYMYLRVWRPLAVPPHRVLFSTATVVLAVQAAAAVIASAAGRTRSAASPGWPRCSPALLAYAAVNMTLIVAAIVLSGPEPQPGRVPAGARPRRRRGAGVRHAVHGGAHRGRDGHLRPGLRGAGAAPADRPAPRGAGPAAGGGGQHRQQDRAAERGRLGHRGRPGGAPDRAARRQRHRAACSTWTTSSRSTTSTGTWSGTRCWWRWPRRSGTWCATTTWSAGSAARSSWSCCPPRTATRAGSAPRRWPTASAAASRSCASTSRRSAGELVVDDLSVSIGGATSPADGTQLADLLKVADAAMYAAKEAGRNRVFMGLHSIRAAPRAEPDAGAVTVGQRLARRAGTDRRAVGAPHRGA